LISSFSAHKFSLRM